MSDDLAHLPPNVRPIAELDDEERIAHIKQVRWIEYPAAKYVMDRIDDVYAQLPSKRMDNLLLTARSGAGKTSLIDRVKRRGYSGLDASRGAAQRSLVVVLMPPKPTEKELLWSIGRALGTPAVELTHLEGPRLRVGVFEQLRNLGVRMLVIDEINSVLVGTPREQRGFLQLLRFLSNEIEAALVCVGTPEAQQALRADEQLRSRFSNVELPLWETGGSDLQTFVSRFVQSMPMRQPSPVVSPAICKILADRSGGITDGISKALRRAAVSAVRSKKEMIDLAGLQDESVWVTTMLSNPPYGPRTKAGS